MSLFRGVHWVAVAALVVSCTQPEPEPPRISGQPIFDKFGGVIGCEGGVYIPGAPIDQQCEPPLDECEEQIPGTAAVIPCPPPREDCDPQTSTFPCPPGQRDDEDRDPDSTPNTPGTAPG